MSKLFALLAICLAVASTLAAPGDFNNIFGKEPDAGKMGMAELSSNTAMKEGNVIISKGVKGANGNGSASVKGVKGKGITTMMMMNKATKAPKRTRAPKGGKSVKGRTGRASPVVKNLIKALERGEDINRAEEIQVNKYLMTAERMQIRSAEIAAGTFDRKAYRTAQRQKARSVAGSKGN
jgi:hypothetical protein